METKSVEFDVEKAYSLPLPKPVHVGPYTVELFETMQEVRDAGEKLNDDQYVQAINARRSASARAKETEKALKAAGFSREDAAKDPSVIKAQQIKLIIKMAEVSGTKLTEAQAEQVFEAQQKLAASLVGA